MAKVTMTEAEFCRTVGISRVTAWRLRSQGKLPYCKIGVKILYRPEHIAQFLADHERQASVGSNFPKVSKADVS